GQARIEAERAARRVERRTEPKTADEALVGDGPVVLLRLSRQVEQQGADRRARERKQGDRQEDCWMPAHGTAVFADVRLWRRLDDFVEFVDFGPVDALDAAAWPANFNIVDGGPVSQAEMQFARGLRQVAAGALHLARQDLLSCVEVHQGPDRIAVAVRP